MARGSDTMFVAGPPTDVGGGIVGTGPPSGGAWAGDPAVLGRGAARPSEPRSPSRLAMVAAEGGVVSVGGVAAVWCEG